MKALFRAQARRVDALSLRERAIMFVSVALALAAVADAMVLSPAMAERRALVAQLRQQNQELDALRMQLKALMQVAPESPLGRQRAAVEQARGELAQLESQLKQRLAGRDAATRLPELLERTLRRHERLTLTKLVTAADTPAPSGSAAIAPAADEPALHWQGVELGVAGNYLDLMHYLVDLEQALPGLRWGPLQISTQSTPPLLTVKLLLAGDAP